MTLSLYVDSGRWHAHQQSVLAEFPGLVPVAKGNGYGFGNVRLAREAARLGRRVLAVGTAAEAADAAEAFPGDLLVLTPYRVGEEEVALPAERVIRTVAHVESLRALPPGTRTVVECLTSMRRHGISPGDLSKIGGAAAIDGFALHLPLDRPDGSDAADEVAEWVRAIDAAGLPTGRIYLSHLSSKDIARLADRFPGADFRSRIGTRLWLGEIGALEARGTVLDVTPLARGERYGYRQHKSPSDGHLLVVTGGTAHGVGLEAPKYVHGVVPRAKGIARAGLATLNRTLSPYAWSGRQLWFAEPPHMQVSILFLPGEMKPPAIGDELSLNVRHTTTHFDRVVTR